MKLAKFFKIWQVFEKVLKKLYEKNVKENW